MPTETLEWQADVLGAPYEAVNLEFAPDDEGEVVATLVRRKADKSNGRAVLHVHGFCDYFFQVAAADYWTSEGYDFYALDLRKYGRSLRPHQTPNFATSLSDYYPELDRAWEIVTADHAEVVISAHSTGGLTTSLWLHDRELEPAAVVLNSPWLELMGAASTRIIGTPIIRRVGAMSPKRVLRAAGDDLSAYCMSIHKDFNGEWDFNLEWKPVASFPVTFGWMRAIREGHNRIAGGINVKAPILVLGSGYSSAPKSPDDPRAFESDIVIDVRQTAERSTKLGKHVTMVRVQGALHDVTLSKKPVRDLVFREISTFLHAYAPLG